MNSLPTKMLEYCVYFVSLTGYTHAGHVVYKTLYTARHFTNHKLNILAHDPIVGIPSLHLFTKLDKSLQLR